ncbi:MAG TPA: MFS transporter [Elusimicrobiota bacterium]|nr:MFS transporter [Elusimicrobiota bacterium]
MTERPPSALASADFRRLTLARFLLTFALQVQTLVMAWQVYSLKHDPLYLGLIGLFEAVPAIGLALFSGDLIDRSDPLKAYKNVIRGCFCSALLLFLVSNPAAGVPPGNRVAWIYLAAFIAGCARGFSQPAMYSLVPQMIPRESLAVSSAWITAAFQTASVVGPGVGGVLFAWKGAPVPYGLDLLLIGGAMIAAALIRLRPKPAPSGPPGETAFRRATSGLRFVFAHGILLPALALDMFAVLFGGVEAILPIFAGDILKIGAAGLGLLQACPAVGALLGSALMIRRPVNRRAGRILLGVVTGFGFCIIGFALSKTVWLSFLLLGLAGGLDSVSMVIRGAIVQISSPDHMRGRVASVNSIFIGTSNEIGAFESGAAAKLLGTVPSVVAGGCLTLATVAAAAVFAPELREMDLDRI